MLHSVKVVRTGDWEARFDDVHAQFGKVARDLEFFGAREGGSGGLLSVAKGGVEDADVVWVGDFAGDVFGAWTTAVEFLDGWVFGDGGGEGCGRWGA